MEIAAGLVSEEPPARPAASNASGSPSSPTWPTRSTRLERGLRRAFPFEPELWLLALDRGEVAGFCLCELGASEGESVGRIAEVGVVPAQRGAGLGFALLWDGFRKLRRRGTMRIVLDVDAEDATSALRLYEKSGMNPRPAFTVWEKPHASAGTSRAEPV